MFEWLFHNDTELLTQLRTFSSLVSEVPIFQMIYKQCFRWSSVAVAEVGVDIVFLIIINYLKDCCQIKHKRVM